MTNAVDKEQIAMLASWWKRYGRFIGLAIVIGLLAGFGFHYWANQKKTYQMNASMVYQSLFDAVGKSDSNRTAGYLRTLKKEFPNSVYASLGALLQARLYADTYDYEDAIKQLDWVIVHGSAFHNFQNIATIRKARILVQQEAYDAALETLKKINDDSFQPLVKEVEGDVYLAKGDTVDAKKAYEAAKAGFNADQMDNPLLKLKLQSL